MNRRRWFHNRLTAWRIKFQSDKGVQHPRKWGEWGGLAVWKHLIHSWEKEERGHVSESEGELCGNDFGYVGDMNTLTQELGHLG